MPKIPTFEGTARVKAQPIAARAQELPLSTFAAKGKTLEGLGDALLAAEAKMANMRNLKQLTEAKVASNEAILILQVQALNDPDLDENVGAYQQQLREIVTKTTATIGDEATRLQYQGQMATRVQGIGFQLGVEGRKTMNRKSRVALDDFIGLQEEAYFLAGTEVEKQAVFITTEDTINEHRDHGAIDPIAAQKMIDGLDQSFRRFDMERLIDTDPEFARQKLTTGEHGLTNAKLVVDFKDKADAKIEADVKAGQKMISDARDSNEMEIYRKMRTGELSLTFISTREGDKAITPEFRDLAQEWVLSDKKFVQKSNPDIRLELFKQIHSKDGRSPDDVRRLFRSVIQASVDGDLSMPDMWELNGVIDGEYQDAAANSRHGLISKMTNAVDHWVKEFAGGNSQITLDHVLDVTEGIKSGRISLTNPAGVIADAVRSVIEDIYPSTVGQSRSPQALMSRDGRVRPIQDHGADVRQTPADLVPMRHPDGRKLMVPRALVGEAQQVGATLIVEPGSEHGD